MPRVAGALLGLALLRSGGAALVGVGALLLALSVMTNPATWWRYVRTGARSPGRPAPEFSEPGACSVELQDPGSRPVEVIRALREVTGAALPHITATVSGAPATVAQRLSEDSARRVRERVERAGATASVRTARDADGRPGPS